MSQRYFLKSEANCGIGCLSKVTLDNAFKRGGLVSLAVKGRDFSRKFYFVLHKKKYRGLVLGSGWDCAAEDANCFDLEKEIQK